MPEALSIVDQRLLDGTVQTVYTVPANHTFVAKTIAITNYSTTTIPTVSIWLVASAGSAGNNNILVKDKAIITGETVFLNPDMYLQAGYSIRVQASANAVLNCQVSGVDMS